MATYNVGTSKYTGASKSAVRAQLRRRAIKRFIEEYGEQKYGVTTAFIDEPFFSNVSCTMRARVIVNAR